MENWLLAYTVDLAKGDQAVSVLAPNVLALPGDNLAHTWMVLITRNGVPADLTGATATAYFTRGDGNTVMLVGTAEGNVCAYTMLSTCYAVPGPLRCVLKVTSPTIGTVTLLDKIVQVRQGVGGSIIDPGTAIPSLEQLLAAVPAAEAATKAAQVAANMGAGLNLLYNSGFYANTDGWTLATGITRDTTKKLFGASSIKFLLSGLATDEQRYFEPLPQWRTPVAVGEVFTFSVWLYMDNYATVDSAGPQISAGVTFHNAAGTQLAEIFEYLTPASDNNGRWVRISKTVTVTEATATSMGFRFRLKRNGTIWMAAMKIERGNEATDWRPSWADILALPYMEDWKQPTILNSWAENASYPVRFCKDASGIVHCKGRFVSAAGSVDVFVFPAGYRPGSTTWFALPRSDDFSKVVMFSIGPGGNVVCNATLAASTGVDISGICFRADQ